MNAHLRIALISVMLTCASVLRSQPVQFLMPVLNQQATGTIVTIPVKVVNFDSILSAQFVIRWNTAVLSFFAITNYNLPDLSAQNFNLNNTVDSGLIRFAWESPNNMVGTSKPDSTIIFKVKFSVVGPLLSGSAVKITEAFPTFFEVTKLSPNGDLTAITLNQAGLTQGFVAIGYTVGTVEPALAALHVQLYPNPVQSSTQLKFELPEAMAVAFTLTDPTGRILEQTKPQYMPQGENVFDIPNIEQLEHGLYYLSIRTEQHAGVLSFSKF
jgi:hypothetical protein